MALLGHGAVAIWHDIAPDAREQFYAWHGEEHMPERAGVRGFLRGRRYVALEGEPEYFNLYETIDTAVLTGRDYLARLNAPTPWTVDTVRHFRGVARSLCDVAASAGAGDGGLVATYRYAVDGALADAHRANMARVEVPAIVARAGVAGAHLLVADAAASAVETAERKARREQNEIPGWILLVEGWGDEAPFVALARTLAQSPLFADAAATPSWAVYRLQNQRLAPR